MFFNLYSFIIVAVLLALVAGIVLLRNKPNWRDFLAFGAIVGGLIAAWLILHPVQTPLMEETKKVQALIGAGKPVLLHFQSPYCIGCISVKPAVDALEQEVEDRLLIVRVNIQEEVGKELGSLYGFEYTPTFIFFDANGKELWRTVGSFDADKVRDSLR